jgi:ribosomal protein L9
VLRAELEQQEQARSEAAQKRLEVSEYLKLKHIEQQRQQQESDAYALIERQKIKEEIERNRVYVEKRRMLLKEKELGQKMKEVISH